LGGEIADGGQTIRVAQIIPNPAFDANTYAHDIGVVRLATPVSAAVWPVWSMPLRPSDVGTDVRIVGFGVTSLMDTGHRIKRQGFARISQITAGKFVATPDPATACFSDSGGPSFVTSNGAEYLIGVTSTGDPNCATFMKATRVDTEVSSFLAPY